MTATGHAIIGTLIAAKIGNPTLAIPIAVVSHLAADAIPHWDAATNAKGKGRKKLFRDATIDVILGFVLSFLIIEFLFPSTNLTYAFIIIIAAQSLDWLTIPFYFMGISAFKPFYKFQKIFDRKLDKPWGIINQVAILVLLVALAKVF